MSILKGDRHLIFNCLPPVNLENYQIAYLWSTDIYTKTLEVIKMLACSRRPKTLGITRVVVLVAFLTINSFNDFAKLPLFLSLSHSSLSLYNLSLPTFPYHLTIPTYPYLSLPSYLTIPTYPYLSLPSLPSLPTYPYIPPSLTTQLYLPIPNYLSTHIYLPN